MRIAVVLSGALVLVASLCLPVSAQSKRIESGSGQINNRFAFYYDTHLDPATPELTKVHGGILVADEAFHRFMLDSGRRVYFGYDVVVQTLPEAGTYQLIFRPLNLPLSTLRSVTGDDGSGWTQVPTPGWGGQPSRTLRRGEVLELSLLTNSATGQRIVDYVTIQEPPRPRVGFDTLNTPVRDFEFVGGPARDFRLDDAELKIQAPRLSINGKVDPSTASRDMEAAGRIVWVYVANRGRFLLSLTPQRDPGFRKAGEVRGSTLTFKAGNDTFSIVAGAPIAPSHSPFNVYVLHEPAWKPNYPLADLSASSFGTFENPGLPARK